MGYPSVTRSYEDPSIAYTCLLEFPWYATADTRDTGGIIDRLVFEWRKRTHEGNWIDCLPLAIEMQQELCGILADNQAARGL